MSAALEGIKILDLSRYAPGWYGTMILGDYGADTLKVEGAPSDLVVPEFTAPDSPYDPFNRNKRSIVLNLKHEEARKIFYALVREHDVVVEGFRPGVTKRLAIDYESLKSINERLIYCSLSGYGQSGPYWQLAGHDLNYISQAGALGVLREPHHIPGNILGDLVAGGMQVALGVLIALQARQRTGKGQYIDIAITDGVLSLIAPYVAKYFETGQMPRLEDRATIGGTAYYNVYETKDGKFISIASGERSFFVNLCKILGCEEFIPYQLDGDRQPEIKSAFASRFLTKTRDEWFEELSKADTAVGKVLDVSELAFDPQLASREMIVELDHPEVGKVKQTGIPIKFSDTPGSIRGFSPRAGQHTGVVLKGLGYEDETISKLAADGAIFLSD
jgi:crotonobetainyl-CoA:carnitine CoA-transferase CaiB-like acyl-CoA transferase